MTTMKDKKFEQLLRRKLDGLETPPPPDVWERIEAALATIGSDDLREIIEEDGQAELQCHFCLKKYQFNKDELTEILERLQH